VHDAFNTVGAGQSTMVSQDIASGQIDYLNFNHTAISGSLLLSGNWSGLTPVEGTQVAKQYFGL
jgi:hypothetical protein